ncbi:PH domain-containing protein [Sphingobacterium sp.]|uniref:PH domain-containing protein n=1 Tax=Sphingobacterium sp. TaxID=341027 RepID=UPI0028A643F6|nr:PH domain-containing protein [Sphingobacterium sp.]
MATYKSKWDNFYLLIFFAILIPVFTGILAISKAPLSEYLTVLPTLLACILVFYLITYFTTSYKIDSEYLRYRCLVFFGKVKVKSIRRIEVGKTLYSGMKPATAMKGLIIYYDKYEEVYISPIDNEEVVNVLLKINPQIEVIYYNKKQD